MKQHVTVEQMNEVSAAQYLRLVSNPQANDLLDVITYQEKGTMDRQSNVFHMSTFCTIGKIIEFTKNHLKGNCALRIVYEGVIDADYPGKMMWFVSIVEYEVVEDYVREHCINFQEDELCDALWQAVKYILEEENK